MRELWNMREFLANQELADIQQHARTLEAIRQIDKYNQGETRRSMIQLGIAVIAIGVVLTLTLGL